MHPDTLAAARDLQQRRFGKTLVLGGTRLQRAARDALTLGDSPLELAIERDGNKFAIARSRYWPTFSFFVEEGEDGELDSYRQQLGARPNPQLDPTVNPVKLLHLSYEQRGLYGMPITFQSLDAAWFKLKQAAADLEKATTDLGVNPWLHIMPEGKEEAFKDAYKNEYEGMLRQGVVTNLFLLHGADLKKASATNPSLSVLFDAVIQYRFQMIPPGVPVWMFPGLNVEIKGGKEIANQPALAYARMIADLRASMGEQIRWAICLEIICRHFDKGYDTLVNDGYFDFDVVWPEWDATALDSAISTANTNDSSIDPESESPADETERLVAQAESLLQTSTPDDVDHLSQQESSLLLTRLEGQRDYRFDAGLTARLHSAIAGLSEVALD
ncbi:MAG: hypothetical protein AAF978_09360 [Cyanobacteria bacterium P01_E01_bin.48]